MKNEEFNKAEFERKIKNICSKKDFMVKRKRVSFETPRNSPIYELFYGDEIKKSQNPNTEVWETYRDYN